jgi:hypothetical protein
MVLFVPLDTSRVSGKHISLQVQNLCAAAYSAITASLQTNGVWHMLDGCGVKQMQTMTAALLLHSYQTLPVKGATRFKLAVYVDRL